MPFQKDTFEPRSRTLGTTERITQNRQSGPVRFVGTVASLLWLTGVPESICSSISFRVNISCPAESLLLTCSLSALSSLSRPVSSRLRCFSNSSHRRDPSRSCDIPVTSPLASNQDSTSFSCGCGRSGRCRCHPSCHLLPGSGSSTLYELHSLLPQVLWKVDAYWSEPVVTLWDPLPLPSQTRAKVLQLL